LCAFWIQQGAWVTQTLRGIKVALSTGCASIKSRAACVAVFHIVDARLAEAILWFPVLSAGDAERAVLAFYALWAFCTALITVVILTVIYFRYAGEALVHGRAGQASVHLAAS
jgi:hypothetical protein